MKVLCLDFKDLGEVFAARDPVYPERAWIIRRSNWQKDQYTLKLIKNHTESYEGQDISPERLMWNAAFSCIKNAVDVHLNNYEYIKPYKEAAKILIESMMNGNPLDFNKLMVKNATN